MKFLNSIRTTSVVMWCAIVGVFFSGPAISKENVPLPTLASVNKTINDSDFNSALTNADMGKLFEEYIEVGLPKVVLAPEFCIGDGWWRICTPEISLGPVNTKLVELEVSLVNVTQGGVELIKMEPAAENDQLFVNGGIENVNFELEVQSYVIGLSPIVNIIINALNLDHHLTALDGNFTANLSISRLNFTADMGLVGNDVGVETTIEGISTVGTSDFNNDFLLDIDFPDAFNSFGFGLAQSGVDAITTGIIGTKDYLAETILLQHLGPMIASIITNSPSSQPLDRSVIDTKEVQLADGIPFYAIDNQKVPVPEGVYVHNAVWTPKGDHILFQDFNTPTGQEWLADVDGKNIDNVRCLTCDHEDRPHFSMPGFAYMFPDEKRLHLSTMLGDETYVLECSPSIYQCDTHTYIPISMNDARFLYPDIGARTFHLAPDGEHVGYTLQRLDSLLMIIARLEKISDSEYAYVDHKVVNPPAALKPWSTDSTLWANGGVLYEIKSFADGGRSILALGQRNGLSYDQVKIDLQTGAMTTIGGGPDWDEDGAISPDGMLDVVGSWRTMHRLDSYGLFQGSRPFIAAPTDAMFAQAYMSSATALGCDLQPWLIPGTGDRDGTYLGQPLGPYTGGDYFTGNNLPGFRMWHPDSTRVLLQARSLEPLPPGSSNYAQNFGPTPPYLLIANIHKEPTEPKPVVSSRPGTWATSINDYEGNWGHLHQGIHIVAGKFGGTATIAILGNLAAGTSSVQYTNFSDQFSDVTVNGSTTILGSSLIGLTYKSNLVAHDDAGLVVGTENIDVTFVPNFNQILTLLNTRTAEPPFSVIGSASSTWLDQEASGIALVEACPDLFPRRPDLKIKIEHSDENTLKVKVIGKVEDPSTGQTDNRPVSGATVRLNDQVVTTNTYGIAILQLPVDMEDNLITATAGNTFESASIRF